MSVAEAMLAKAYTIEDQNIAAWGGKEWLRLELLMDYSEAYSGESQDVYPVAAVRWTVLNTKLANETSIREFKIILAACLYAKALALNQFRAELFRQVGEALQQCLASGDPSAAKPLAASDLTFAPMFIKAGPFTNIVWPWEMESWSQLEERRPGLVIQEGTSSINLLKVLSATLLSGPTEPRAPSGMWLRFRTDATLTKVFVPAAALIAMSHVWHEVPEGHGMLWSLLNSINQYHEKPSRITSSEVFAMHAAMEVLASGGKRSVAEFRGRDGLAVAIFSMFGALRGLFRR